MSRIEAQECQYTDIEWYGVDRRGNIAVFLSAGEGNIPEFVCENKERTEALNAYFEAAGSICGTALCLELRGGAKVLAEELAGKGLFYFDSNDGLCPGVCNGQRHYTKLAQPEKPLVFADLPANIRELLKPNGLPVDDFTAEKVIDVPHAY